MNSDENGLKKTRYGFCLPNLNYDDAHSLCPLRCFHISMPLQVPIGYALTVQTAPPATWGDAHPVEEKEGLLEFKGYSE